MSARVLCIALLSSLALASCHRKAARSAAARLLYSENKLAWTLDRVYHLGDTIELHLAKEHPAELAIKNPKGDFYYLVYDKRLPTIPGGKPIMGQETFKATEVLRFPTTSFAANPHDVRFKGNKKVFTQSGTYIILLSDNLSTDDGTTVEQLEIRYEHAKAAPRP